jgi:signal transduction histidine kinase
VLNAIKADRVLLAGAIFRADGRLFAQYVKPGESAIPAPPAVPYHVMTAEHATVWMPILGREIGSGGTMALRMSMDIIYTRFRLYALTSLAVMLATVLIAYLLSNRLQRLISQPLLSLAGAADRVTEQKDFSVRVTPASEDEIGKLAIAFNSMLATIQAGEAESARLYDQVRAYATGLEARVKERTAQLQEAYDGMESFSYSVSHDLRGPLRHIGSYMEMLLENEEVKRSPESVEYGHKIQRAVRRMDELIHALLEFSRLTKKEPDVATVDISRMCDEIVAEFRSDPKYADTAVTIERMSPALADPVLLRQVLTNLLGNAFKYSRKSPAPRISVSEVPIPGPEGVAYAVKDNGVGFNPAQARNLFTVFVRLHDSRQFEGTGVGLATVKRILQRHGGRIWAESAVGAGATFFFTLPRVASQQADNGAERPGTAKAD